MPERASRYDRSVTIHAAKMAAAFARGMTESSGASKGCYPDQVAGMVFIDATYPDLKSLLDPALWSSFAAPLANPTSPIDGYDIEGYDLDGLMIDIEAAPGIPLVPAVFLCADRVETGDAAFDRAYLEILPDLRERFVARFPGATSSVVPDTTHYIQVERPDAVTQAITGLLGS